MLSKTKEAHTAYKHSVHTNTPAVKCMYISIKPLNIAFQVPIKGNAHNNYLTDINKCVLTQSENVCQTELNATSRTSNRRLFQEDSPRHEKP